MVTSRLSWTAAGRYCRAVHRDAHLLVINDAEEQSAVAGMLASNRRLYKFLCFVHYVRCGWVAEWLGSRTCDQQVTGSNPGRRAAECNPGQVLYTHVSLSPSSIIWYQPMGGDAQRLVW